MCVRACVRVRSCVCVCVSMHVWDKIGHLKWYASCIQKVLRLESFYQDIYDNERNAWHPRNSRSLYSVFCSPKDTGVSFIAIHVTDADCERSNI